MMSAAMNRPVSAFEEMSRSSTEIAGRADACAPALRPHHRQLAPDLVRTGCIRWSAAEDLWSASL